MSMMVLAVLNMAWHNKYGTAATNLVLSQTEWNEWNQEQSQEQTNMFFFLNPQKNAISTLQLF